MCYNHYQLRFGNLFELLETYKIITHIENHLINCDSLK